MCWATLRNRYKKCLLEANNIVFQFSGNNEVQVFHDIWKVDLISITRVDCIIVNVHVLLRRVITTDCIKFHC